ncbi:MULTISPECIES: hypothetical protein [Burkholderia]|uniref:Uncharacterized protein n=1 Tax=Burkholderia cepacia TaxID=292 RepID=A0AA88Z4A5_BURCE|nr:MULTISPECIES: hypothetical protein [Burkholderia]KGB98882.1 hypothetical protein DM43_3331 [Burkholderia cepacia]
MDTHLMIGLGVLLGAAAAAATRDLLRAMKAKAQMKPVPVRVRDPRRPGR